MAFNKNEVILDRIRSLTAHDLTDGSMLFRLTSLEEPSLNCTAEGEEVTDAVGAVITTMYRSKKAEFAATNSLISLDLAAAQYGVKKEVAATDLEILDQTFEVLDVKTADTAVTLTHKPDSEVKYVYAIVSGEVGTEFKAGAAASETEFVISEAGEITPPTGFVGKLFVEYQYKNENALRIRNTASDFPEACSVVIYAYFRDVCNENIVYSGKILLPKAKLNPESVELALTSTGKHAFSMTAMKDYCADDENDELFTILLSE